jgi:hypothetical protein
MQGALLHLRRLFHDNARAMTVQKIQHKYMYIFTYVCVSQVDYRHLVLSLDPCVYLPRLSYLGGEGSASRHPASPFRAQARGLIGS